VRIWLKVLQKFIFSRRRSAVACNQAVEHLQLFHKSLFLLLFELNADFCQGLEITLIPMGIAEIPQ